MMKMMVKMEVMMIKIVIMLMMMVMLVVMIMTIKIIRQRVTTCVITYHSGHIWMTNSVKCIEK